MVPPHVHMVSPHVNCLHVLYASYGPQYLIWNRYHVVPHMYDMMSMTLTVPHTLYGIGIRWSPLPYIEQLSWSPHMYIWSPHM